MNGHCFTSCKFVPKQEQSYRLFCLVRSIRDSVQSCGVVTSVCSDTHVTIADRVITKS
jgi:hypothetical protein